ncbi:hypothetical protein HDU76_005948 [Blyttiomyces sp. JEL0837]|nr:hypothetical protein HDU76_005948 [Blyttiomyces sp. JEL0837]
MAPKTKTSKSTAGKSKAKDGKTKTSQSHFGDDNWSAATVQTKGRCGGKNKRQGDLVFNYLSTSDIHEPLRSVNFSDHQVVSPTRRSKQDRRRKAGHSKARELGVGGMDLAAELDNLTRKLDDSVNGADHDQEAPAPPAVDEQCEVNPTQDVEVVHVNKFDKIISFSNVEVADDDDNVNASGNVDETLKLWGLVLCFGLLSIQNNETKNEVDANLRDSAVSLEEGKASCEEDQDPRMILEGLRMMIPLVGGWRCLMAVL